jgi:KUP system potassium uptake protein
VLSITGVEALYADLGHFGALPIRISFFLFVYLRHVIGTWREQKEGGKPHTKTKTKNKNKKAMTMRYPSLLLSYIGQGALLITDPTKNNNPFFNSTPHALFWPQLVLATVATIIASQSIASSQLSSLCLFFSICYAFFHL